MVGARGRSDRLGIVASGKRALGGTIGSVRGRVALPTLFSRYNVITINNNVDNSNLGSVVGCYGGRSRVGLSIHFVGARGTSGLLGARPRSSVDIKCSLVSVVGACRRRGDRSIGGQLFRVCRSRDPILPVVGARRGKCCFTGRWIFFTPLFVTIDPFRFKTGRGYFARGRRGPASLFELFGVNFFVLFASFQHFGT